LSVPTRKTAKEAEEKNSFKGRAKCAPKVFDTADIVRDVRYRDLAGVKPLPGPITAGNGIYEPLRLWLCGIVFRPNANSVLASIRSEGAR